MYIYFFLYFSDPRHNSISPSSIVVYQDLQSSPRNLYWVDSSTVPATPLAGNNITHTRLDNVVDMTCVVSPTLRLLLACSNDTLEAYDGKFDKRLWKVTGKLCGFEKDIRPSSIDTDGKHTVFVCDIANACVQVFSFYGEYQGYLVKKGEKGIGCPRSITFHITDGEKSLEILHEQDDGKLHIDTFELGRRSQK